MPEEKPLKVTKAEKDFLRDLMRALSSPSGGGGIGMAYSPGSGFSFTGGRRGRRVRGGGALVRRMVVKSGQNDYLVCRPLDGDDGEGPLDIPVAKPPELRHDKDIYPNVSVLTTVGTEEVDVTVSGASETWILPSELGYVGNSTHILAVRCGKTGVQTVGGSPEDIVWMDLNNAGRVWIKEED